MVYYMKRVVIFIILLVVISSSAYAFSIRDILSDFRDSFVGLATKTDSSIDSSQSASISSLSDTSTDTSSVNLDLTPTTNTTNGTSNLGETQTATLPGGLTPAEETVSSKVCADGTGYSQCSQTKPLYCNNGVLINNCNQCGCPIENECINNQCIKKEPYDPGGQEGNDENDLNILPQVLPIGLKIVKIHESIQFPVIAIDENEEDIITNSLSENPTEFVDCSISNSLITCEGIKVGEEIITIITSDGIDEKETRVEIIVLDNLPEQQTGVAAGFGNTLPTADAGLDITGFPGQKIILDASKSFDNEGLLSIPDTYKWYENNNFMGSGKTIESIFSLGTHAVKLVVTDSEGETDEDSLNVIIKEKKACKNTNTFYYPEDTICNSKWPVKEGEEIKINSLTDGSCGLFEVCSDDIDYVIEDSIKCCNGELLDPDKTIACSFANENSETFRNCQAFYVIKSLGKSAVYLKDYFDAEMCCKGVDALCPKEDYLYTPNPLPDYLRGVRCSNTPDNNPNGYWASDTRLELNEIALFDAPAHSSLNILKTGTCVDYSVSATTLLRKIGFSSEDVLTIEAADHAYNALRLDLYKKYLIFDMTGNNNGLNIGGVPGGYEYCENVLRCYNDLGQVQCPNNEKIMGCEGIKPKLGREAQDVGFKVTNIFVDLFNKIRFEILR